MAFRFRGLSERRAEGRAHVTFARLVPRCRVSSSRTDVSVHVCSLILHCVCVCEMVGVYRRGEEGIFLVLTGYAAITLPLSTPVLMCFFFFSFLSQITSPSGCCQSLPLYVIFHILPLKLLIKLSPGNLSRFPGSPGSSTSQYGADFMVKKKKKTITQREAGSVCFASQPATLTPQL